MPQPLQNWCCGFAPPSRARRSPTAPCPPQPICESCSALAKRGVVNSRVVNSRVVNSRVVNSRVLRPRAHLILELPTLCLQLLLACCQLSQVGAAATARHSLRALEIGVSQLELLLPELLERRDRHEAILPNQARMHLLQLAQRVGRVLCRRSLKRRDEPGRQRLCLRATRVVGAAVTRSPQRAATGGTCPWLGTVQHRRTATLNRGACTSDGRRGRWRRCRSGSRRRRRACGWSGRRGRWSGWCTGWP